MSLIKDIYSPAFYDRFADILTETLPSFRKDRFLELIFSTDFEQMEWKQRMKHSTWVLHTFMPEDFSKAVILIKQLIDTLRAKGFTDDNLAFMFLPDYIETYGINHLEASASAFEFVTGFISCEFAVRPFILKYDQEMIRHMRDWSLHESPKVRRLASEGSRPRLPWAMAIPALKKNPESILPILENLKNDPSESVRRSVANSLNDIAKDNPEIVLSIAKKWKGISKETDAVVKHGSRTLLKQGHGEILKHFGLESNQLVITDFCILTPIVKIGDSVAFSFAVKNDSSEPQLIRLEYAVYYFKSNGSLSRKVFKISERTFEGNEKVVVHRKQSFRLITTRKFYTGGHQLSVIANGEEKTGGVFELIE